MIALGQRIAHLVAKEDADFLLSMSHSSYLPWRKTLFHFCQDV